MEDRSCAALVAIIKINRGFNARRSKDTSSHCSAGPRQISHGLQRLIDDITVIDEPLDKPDRPHLAYHREELKLTSLSRTMVSRGVRQSDSY